MNKPIKKLSLNEFIDFLRTNLESYDHDSGGSTALDFPDFELKPHEYLDFASKALTGGTDADKINCVAHLKRAVECETDTFIAVLNIQKNPNLKNFPKKMSFIQELGLMPSRSVSKLNKIRNRMEHEYSIPEIDDLSLYFDLVAGYVAAIEGAIFMLASHMEICFCHKSQKRGSGLFEIKLVPNKPSIEYFIEKKGVAKLGQVKPQNWAEFVIALRILFLLIRNGFVVSSDYVLDQLSGYAAT